jgi:hypothetical protein
MAIVQISKIQQRAGNLVDLPQLDEAEFGWASDTKRLFIGKTTPNENIEVLTGYSEISFSQIDGSGGGNLNISNAQTGQILTYVDSTNTWINYTGNIEPLGNTKIQLGPVENLKIEGGAIGYVLETDGLGNLSWSPKSTIIAFIENVTKANPGVVTTTQDNFFAEGAEITITDAAGMTNLNGQSYYANILTSNTFALYSDPGLSLPVNTSSFNTYSYTSVTGTTVATNVITVGNSSLFSVNQEVMFLGDLENSGLENSTPYYIKAINSGTEITVSLELLANGTAGNVQSLQTETLTANMYATGGRIVSAVSGGGTSAAEGSNTTVQFNNNNILDGDADFSFNFAPVSGPKILTLVGNANVGNLNATGVATSTRYISNVPTGTAPLTVTSTTRVANLNVAYSNVTDFVNITTATTGTYYPLMTNGLTGNVPEFANNALSFNALTGNLSTTLLNVTSNANIGNVGTATLIATTGNIGTINSGLLQNGNSNITITANGNVSVTAAGGTTELVITSTGVNVAGTLNATGNANVGNIGATSGVLTGTLSVTGNANVGNIGATSGVLTGTLSVTGNANVGNIGATSGVLTGTLSVTGNANVGNIGATSGVFTGTLSVTSNANVGNIGATAGVFTGNVSALNANLGNVASANYLTGTLTTAAQPNITSVGTLTSLDVTGNVTSGNLYANSGTLGASNANVVTLNVSGRSNLNAVGNVYISGGNANQILKTDGAGNLSWTDPNGGYYLHTQGSANTVWTVTHNLNRQYVTVEAIDANGNSYTGRYDYPTISYTNANALTMTFTSAVQGYAAVTGGGTNINSVSVGNSTPGGVNTQVQFNDAGALAGSSGLVYNKTTGTLTATLYAGSGANLTNIAGANVTGAVSFATTANAVAGANVSGAVSFATTANAVAGANVSGAVAFATTANAVAGANVSGAVSFATTANAVAGANVSGTVSQATTVMGATQNNITTLGALTTLSTGANTTAGTITGNWTLSAGSRLQATYADLAEYYEADQKYEPGTVLEFGGEKEVTLAADGTRRVAGVVTTNPAYVMNATCPGILAAIALQGRTPCKVRGIIKKGDMLISGGNGFARPESSPSIGAVIGKALENHNGGEGVIEVAVGRV